MGAPHYINQSSYVESFYIFSREMQFYLNHGLCFLKKGKKRERNNKISKERRQEV